jgi:hydrogenase expression/formation protein HypD
MGTVKYVDEFRDGGLARGIAGAIRAEARPDRRYNLMEFCGGHTHAIFRYGVADLLPDNVRMVHGPGCPVCVLPMGRIDNAVAIARRDGVILCAYGDTLRVPGSGRTSLLGAKAEGADVRMVYSSTDALRTARANRDRQVVFFAIGFETTAPPTAAVLAQARAEGLDNFSVFCNHVLTPPAMRHLLDGGDAGAGEETGRAPRIDGFVGPAHVSAVIGTRPYAFVASEYHRPVVVAGFEPLDVMQAVLMLIRQVNEGRAEVENEFTRVVTPDGNRKAKALMDEAFECRPSFEWRGLGPVPRSALRLRPEYAAWDAESRFEVAPVDAADHRACECPAILRGALRPTDCRLFATICTPDNPIGACMVSSEGACAAYYTYGGAVAEEAGA